MTTDLLPSISIEALLAARDNAQAAFARAAQLHREAQAMLAPFGAKLPALLVRFGSESFRDATDCEWQAAIETEIDRNIWQRLFALTNVETLMDHKTRRELWERLEHPRFYARQPNDSESLPPLTAENIEATFGHVRSQVPEYFERGVEAVYQALSWDHKTNEPSRIGSKLIVNGAFYNWPRRMQGDTITLDRNESLHDLERVLCVIDGQPGPVNGSGLRSMSHLKWGTWYEVPSPSGGTPLMRLKVFRTGTTHVEILNKEHVNELNRIMARRHPGAIPEPPKSKAARQREEAQPRGTTVMAKSEKAARQAYYTPEDLAARVIEAAKVSKYLRLLEPSAGEGALVRAALRAGVERVTAIEADPAAAELLRKLSERGREHERFQLDVQERDFLLTKPEPIYDSVVMNPPFAQALEVEHVLHAWKFVAPGGRLVSIMSRAVTFRTDGRYGVFARFLQDRGAVIEELPSGSFAEAGTKVETVLVSIRHPEPWKPTRLAR